MDALVQALPAHTPGLALWDVVNEPESGGNSGLAGETGPRWKFVKHFVEYLRSKTSTPTTVGPLSPKPFPFFSLRLRSATASTLHAIAGPQLTQSLR